MEKIIGIEKSAGKVRKNHFMTAVFEFLPAIIPWTARKSSQSKKFGMICSVRPTVRKNCFSYQEKLLKFEAEG